MALRLFFEYENLVVQLPVNPSELFISSTGNNESKEVVKLGEITVIRQPKLESLSIKSFLPVDSSPSYVLTKGKFEEPQFYIDFFNRIRNDKKPCRFIVSDTKINMLVSIESFEYGYEGADDDIHFTLNLKAYRKFSSKVIKIPPVVTNTTPKASQKQTTRPKTDFSIGDIVVVNGRYWHTSYGDPPYGTFNNFVGKISHKVASTSRKYRYHITTLDGKWRGWVAESQMKHKE